MSGNSANYIQLSLQVQKLQQEINFLKLRNEWHLRVWLTAEEVEAILEISERTLQTMCAKGKLSYSQHEGERKRYFKTADILAYLEAGYRPCG